MPTPTDTIGDVLQLSSSGSGIWAPGPNAHWKLIGDPIGNGKGFSRAAIVRKLVAQHNEFAGGEKGRSAADDTEWSSAGRGHSQTTFHKQLPGEVKRYLEGNRSATRLFNVTQDPTKAGGADAMGDLGEDRYFQHIDQMSGNKVQAALDHAHSSPDPESRFMAIIHDHLPDTAEGRKAIGSIDAGRLKVGQAFTFAGEPFRVAEDADGFKVLHGLGEEIPVDALKQVPIDRGSLKKSRLPKLKADEVAPFSTGDGDGVYWLHAPTEFKAAVTLGQGLPSEIHGQPVKYFWANGIAAGSYTHPTKGFNLAVDRRRLDGWVSNFAKTKANGVRIPVNVDHSNKARDAMGFVVDMKRDGDTLKVLHQLIGDDAIRLASRNEISLGINPAFTDGRGTSYGDTIVHSALTPVPVIPGQNGLIAASRESGDGSDSPTILVLSQTEKEATMALTELQLAAFRKLPGAADVAADGAAQWLIDYSTAMTTNCETLLSRAQAAEGHVVTLSRDDKPAHDPEIVRDRADLYTGKIDLSIAHGEMTPTIGKKIKAQLKPEAPNVMLLSRDEELGKRPIDFILELFKGEKMTAGTTTDTGVQVLSREIPDDSLDDKKPAAEHPLMKYLPKAS